MEETYGVYPCDNHYLDRNKDLPYRVEIIEESVPTRKPDTGYTRHRVCEETTTSCPECGKMLDHVSNDETILWIGSCTTRDMCAAIPQSMLYGYS